MSIYPAPIEQLPLNLPPDIELANRVVWHGMQVLFNDSYSRRVQPELAFTSFEDDACEPIAVTIHPDNTFERPKDKPWAYQKARPMYTLGEFSLRATEITVLTAEHSSENGMSSILPRIPIVILDLHVHAALSLDRPDLDDVERRYLERTQYFFWKDRPALRQDVYDVAGKTHRVAQRPPTTELERLHGEVYLSYASCSCMLCVPLDHYGPMEYLTPERFARLGKKQWRTNGKQL